MPSVLSAVFFNLFLFSLFTYEDVLVWVKEKVVLDDDDVRGYVMRMQHFLISVNPVATLPSCSTLFSSCYFDQQCPPRGLPTYVFVFLSNFQMSTRVNGTGTRDLVVNP